MTKAKKIIYWIATLWLALGMTTSGIMQLIQAPIEVNLLSALGYPAYFLTILGVWKLLGVIAILAPKFPLIKEWAYAGFFFAMSGAFISHLAMHEPINAALPALLLLILTVVSWRLRPTSRKIG